ncbi:MAG TPA: cytochrome c3 family protein [Verrucomicrobiae bacterium]|nr:cytochrome c3 family protein [Verrucomicrobiae bacterium]
MPAERAQLPAAILAASAAAVTGILLISCSTTPVTLLHAPNIPGATFVGNKTCAECHTNIVRAFRASPHSRIALSQTWLTKMAAPAPGAGTGGTRATQASSGTTIETSCESCHGPGSLHVAQGGARQFIVNPAQRPDACFECHRQTEAEFHLPQHHPLLEKHMNCAHCHDPHGLDIYKPRGGLAMARRAEACAGCHREQTRPFVFEHPALREGCTVCHAPHGTINAKLLVQPNANLCLRCHAQVQGPSVAPGQIYIGNVDHTALLRMGTCWSSGCHTAVHGSNVDLRLRY